MSSWMDAADARLNNMRRCWAKWTTILDKGRRTRSVDVRSMEYSVVNRIVITRIIKIKIKRIILRTITQY